MSLSHPSDQPIKPARDLKKAAKGKSEWWDDLPAILSCPECGKRAMRRALGSCKLEDGIFIPALERFHCFSCHADFFDDAAMGQIEVHRQAQSSKPIIARRRKSNTRLTQSKLHTV